MDSLVYALLAGYGACAAVFTLMWIVVGWLANRKEHAWTRARRTRR